MEMRAGRTRGELRPRGGMREATCARFRRAFVLLGVCTGCGENTAQLLYSVPRSPSDAGSRMRAYGTPIGYATVPAGEVSTTTGGGSLIADNATSCSELKSLLEDGTPRVIVVRSEIDCHRVPEEVTVCVRGCDSTTGDAVQSVYRVLPAGADDCGEISGWSASDPVERRERDETVIHVSSHKSLLGYGSSAAITGASLYILQQSNIIIQNIAFSEVNPALLEAGDAVTIDGSDHVWIDHCSFSRVSDGFVDAINDSKSITISWNRFDGVNPVACAGQHNYANTFEGATVTLHHNLYDRTLGCSPKLGYGSRGHVFDNYWRGVSDYSIQVGSESHALIQANYFEDSEQPFYASDSCLEDDPPCAISAPEDAPNSFVGISEQEPHQTGGQVEQLPYDASTYTIEPASDARRAVLAGAGPTLLP